MRSLRALNLFFVFYWIPSSSLSVHGRRTSESPPIVYTIAGSDSGGGAGIQADLHAIHAFGCHGCSAITCLTAQNSVGVTDVHAPPASFLRKQLDTLLDDLPPTAIKIGMLGTSELAAEVGSFLERLQQRSKSKTWVVLDPVMISTSGHRLIEEDAQQAMIEHVFPFTDILTPNKYEAEALLDRKFQNIQDVEDGARDLLKLGVPAVLIKGGHLSEDGSFAQDYFLSSESTSDEPRLCDGSRGVWLRSPRYNTKNTHGTGCTLSSATASALALGEQERRRRKGERKGTISSLYPVDACCLAKAYVTAGIFQGIKLGKGPGPVAQTDFPRFHEHFPSIAIDSAQTVPAFRRMKAFHSDSKDDRPTLGRIYPIVDTVEWVERLCQVPGVTDIQLRIKDETEKDRILEKVQKCQDLCKKANVRLWINDYWEAAVKANCFGVHVGQEDLLKCIEAGGLDILREKNTALGISTHSYAELAAAVGVKPTYISLGPIFATNSKNVKFDPQGLSVVTKWRELLPPDMPLVVIGGIGDAASAAKVREAGADCVAVIGAVTQAKETGAAVLELNEAII